MSSGACGMSMIDRPATCANEFHGTACARAGPLRIFVEYVSIPTRCCKRIAYHQHA
jgi:hypothetical protein